MATDTETNSPSDAVTATAVLYLRVSSGAQVNKAHDPEGYSIPGQREACERHAQTLGAEIIGEFVEPGRSGTSMDRPALQELLGRLGELRPAYVIFYDLSRVARDDFDALWLWREIDKQGAKIESTRERVDSSPAGRFMYTILAGVNAMRSRDDAEKIKMGIERRHSEGLSFGPARLGYLNARENVAGREVAVVVPDPDRVKLVQLAFDLFATGDFSITTLTDLMDEAGLRTRGSQKRPSRALSRSQVHRVLRDDFYIGLVTLNGVKRPGRHDPIIRAQTFERVQQLLGAHRASGDRTKKHAHYLSGSLYCTCGKRMGYGRHKSKTGAHYHYFSCLSRVTKQGRCPAPYAPTDSIEEAVTAEYLTERARLDPNERAAVRQAVKDFVEAKAQTAVRESQRHARRLKELNAEQQKLVQLYYRDLVSEDVLTAEQQRIKAERAQAHKWADEAAHDVQNVMQALDEALTLLDRRHIPYDRATPNQRRLLNQAIFTHIFVLGPDAVEAEPNELYKTLIALARSLTRSETASQAEPDGKRSENDSGPVSRGRSSHVDQMAEGEGFEPPGPVTRPNGFQDRRIQPLCHPSGRCVEPSTLGREVRPRPRAGSEARRARFGGCARSGRGRRLGSCRSRSPSG
jgi:site-specific DNA recombinase